MSDIDLSGCGRSILVSMIHDLRKRVAELESNNTNPGAAGVPEEVRDGIVHLFLSIGSWTNSRWDQHLRYEYGDEKTDKIVQWLIAEGILYEVPKDAWAGFEPEGLLPPPAAGQAPSSPTPRSAGQAKDAT